MNALEALRQEMAIAGEDEVRWYQLIQDAVSDTEAAYFRGQCDAAGKTKARLAAVIVVQERASV